MIRSVLWRVGLAAGVVVLAAGEVGLWTAGRGLHSETDRVGGMRVEIVRDSGTAPARRPALVVAHGYAGSGRLMRPFAGTLARRGYVVALPDLAGHASNTRPNTGIGDVVGDVETVVRHLRGLADVDPDRVALLGHSMGAAAVVRAGAADQRIVATVAISLGDDGAAALRPGPRNLMLIRGALEPPGLDRIADRALAGSGHGTRLAVPWVEHVGVLYADATHRSAARWIDDALAHRPAHPVVEAHRRVGGGALTLVGMLLLVTAVLIGPGRPGGSAPPVDEAPAWLGATVVVGPAVGLGAGWLAARVLPAATTGYLIGYFAGVGAVLAIAAWFARRGRARIRAAPQWTAYAVGLGVAGGAAVVVPVHLGLTAMVPHGVTRWALIAALALATALLLGGVAATVRFRWAVAMLAMLGLPLLFAAVLGLAPGFLVVVTPLIAGLFVVYLGLAGAARLAGLAAWCAVPAGAVVIAWPVAAALPLT